MMLGWMPQMLACLDEATFNEAWQRITRINLSRWTTEKHHGSPDCWCQPFVEYEDPITENRVYVHKVYQA